LGFSGLQAFIFQSNFSNGGYESAPKTQPFHIVNRSGTLASLSSSSKLASVPLAQNFCLPAASQLPHPKEMCPNEALNQIALNLADNFPYFAVTYSNQTENVPEQ
jgi:hypothetical protein